MAGGKRVATGNRERLLAAAGSFGSILPLERGRPRNPRLRKPDCTAPPGISTEVSADRCSGNQSDASRLFRILCRHLRKRQWTRAEFVGWVKNQVVAIRKISCTNGARHFAARRGLRRQPLFTYKVTEGVDNRRVPWLSYEKSFPGVRRR